MFPFIGFQIATVALAACDRVNRTTSNLPMPIWASNLRATLDHVWQDKQTICQTRKRERDRHFPPQAGCGKVRESKQLLFDERILYERANAGITNSVAIRGPPPLLKSKALGGHCAVSAGKPSVILLKPARTRRTEVQNRGCVDVIRTNAAQLRLVLSMIDQSGGTPPSYSAVPCV